MTTRLQLIRLPFLVTLGVLFLRFVLDAAGWPVASVLNSGFLIPIFAVLLSLACLRNHMGYGAFIGTFLLYTASVRLAIILLTLLGNALGFTSGYFTSRNLIFGLLLPQVVLWPIASFIAGTLLWPVCAIFTQGRKVQYRGVMTGIGVILILVFLGVPYGISTLYTGGVGGRRAFKQTPAAFGVPFEEIELETSDGLTLRGWYLPREKAKGTVIFCHGLFNERSEMLGQAVFLNQNGYRAVLLDSRRHGKSDGKLVTFGYFERHDIEAAVHFAVDTKGEAGPVILWGISMGAANALMSAPDLPEIKAVIAESSFYTVKETLRRDLGRMFRLPAFPFANLVVWMTELRLNIDLDTLDAGKAMARIGDRAILLVGGTEDQRMPVEINTRLLAAIPGNRKDQLIVQGAAHADAWQMDTDEYKARVLGFLKTYNLTAETAADSVEAKLTP